MRFASRARVGIAVAGVACLSTAVAAGGSLHGGLFNRLSALHSSTPVGPGDLATLEELASRDEIKGTMEAETMWRSFAAATWLFAASLPARGTNEPPQLFVSPDSRGTGVVFAVFSSDQELGKMLDGHGMKKPGVVALRATGEHVHAMMEALNDPKLQGPDGPATVLSLDNRLFIDWKAHRGSWKRAVGACWARKALQEARSDPEIVTALADVLGERGMWFLASRRRPDGTWEPHDEVLGSGPPVFPLFVAADLALRAYPEGQLGTLTGPNVLEYVARPNSAPVVLVHNVAENGALEFVRLDRQRAQRVSDVQRKK
jgi:hypothetical protein